jgi:hypothetical protein
MSRQHNPNQGDHTMAKGILCDMIGNTLKVNPQTVRDVVNSYVFRDDQDQRVNMLAEADVMLAVDHNLPELELFKLRSRANSLFDKACAMFKANPSADTFTLFDQAKLAYQHVHKNVHPNYID